MTDHDARDAQGSRIHSSRRPHRRDAKICSLNSGSMSSSRPWISMNPSGPAKPEPNTYSGWPRRNRGSRPGPASGSRAPRSWPPIQRSCSTSRYWASRLAGPTPFDMLTQLSGRTHDVLTAVSVRADSRDGLALSRSSVTFRAISPAEIADYWQSGEPEGKAGAYAIQGLGAVFVEHLSGSYSGVMGCRYSRPRAC